MFRLRNNIIKTGLVSALLSFSTFFYAPLSLYINNYAQWSFGPLVILPLLLGISVTVTILLSIVILKFGVRFPRLLTIIGTIGILIWLQNNLFSWHAGVLNGESIDWSQNYTKDLLNGLTWIIILSLCIWKYKLFNQHIYKIAAFLLVLQTVFIIQLSSTVPYQSCKNYEYNYQETYSFSPAKNVIVLLLDAFQTDVFQKILNENPKYETLFDGFKYYPDILSGQPTTNPSIELILTGQFYKNEQPIENFIEESFLNKNSIPTALADNGYKVSLPIDPTINCSEKIANQNAKKLSTTIHEGELDTFSKVVSLQLLPSFSREIYYQKNLSSFEDKSQSYFFTDNRTFIHELQTRTTVTNTSPTFKFYHLQGPHLPFILNENLIAEKMPLSAVSYERQSKASLQVAYQLLTELKNLTIYDQSMVFIMGDHGNQEEAEQLIPNQPGKFEFNIPHLKARPLLLIKPFNSHGTLKESSTPASLADIQATIFAALNITNQSTGIDLLNPQNEQLVRDRYFYNYQGWSTNKHFFTAMEEFKVTGPSNLSSSWEKTGHAFLSTGKITTIPPPIPFDTPILFNQHHPENFSYLQKGWDIPEDDQIGANAANASLLLPIVNNDHHLQVIVDTKPFITSNLPEQRINIFINSQFQSQVILNSNTKTFSFNIDKKLINSDKIYLTFNLPNSQSPKELGINNDPRKLSIGLQKLVIKQIHQ